MVPSFFELREIRGARAVSSSCLAVEPPLLVRCRVPVEAQAQRGGGGEANVAANALYHRASAYMADASLPGIGAHLGNAHEELHLLGHLDALWGASP
ncbi:hypothetical protein C4D60_Mb04t37130 [Musa balbisiana]|uniref:Uncharacterized protein n=1 Tax=Musa balbisiana TaxID=52838 RepID=A0A4S8KHJ1_MUSBA|nr:hypothetical protein C4D60_Mb04t37130 [Musa balbisiana]